MRNICGMSALFLHLIRSLIDPTGIGNVGCVWLELGVGAVPEDLWKKELTFSLVWLADWLLIS